MSKVHAKYYINYHLIKLCYGLDWEGSVNLILLRELYVEKYDVELILCIKVEDQSLNIFIGRRNWKGILTSLIKPFSVHENTKSLI